MNTCAKILSAVLLASLMLPAEAQTGRSDSGSRDEARGERQVDKKEISRRGGRDAARGRGEMTPAVVERSALPLQTPRSAVIHRASPRVERIERLEVGRPAIGTRQQFEAVRPAVRTVMPPTEPAVPNVVTRERPANPGVIVVSPKTKAAPLPTRTVTPIRTTTPTQPLVAVGPAPVPVRQRPEPRIIEAQPLVVNPPVVHSAPRPIVREVPLTRTAPAPGRTVDRSTVVRSGGATIIEPERAVRTGLAAQPARALHQPALVSSGAVAASSAAAVSVGYSSHHSRSRSSHVSFGFGYSSGWYDPYYYPPVYYPYPVTYYPPVAYYPTPVAYCPPPVYYPAPVVYYPAPVVYHGYRHYGYRYPRSFFSLHLRF